MNPTETLRAIRDDRYDPDEAPGAAYRRMRALARDALAFANENPGRSYADAETVTVEADENGFELHVLDSDGHRYVFNVHACAWDLAANVDATIGAWRREGEDVRATMRQAAAIADVEGGYALDDPKHPTWADRQADRGNV